MKNGHPKARPFLKWAGGKTQLLDAIRSRLPAELETGAVTRYIEPFAGSGAVFFHLAGHYPLAELYLFDRNEELILAYRALKTRCTDVVDRLRDLQTDYYQLPSEDQKIFYYNLRRAFNETKDHVDFETDRPGLAAVKRTAQLIFLNRTCYNGLFRVNSKGGFNVPFGSYKNPTICDADNLNAVGEVLQRAKIFWGDFETCRTYVTPQTFLYFDPPYRPLNKTSSFTAYAAQPFADAEQQRLAAFYRSLHAAGAKLMLSNSDPHNENPDDNFFDDLYTGFTIHRVPATRMINSKPEGRGPIHELLIVNY
ncbi:MAG: DNA adenine methylase [Anaerolineales bacterium]|nr:DNA adenine methylase [Anaerolineales bacterium]